VKKLLLLSILVFIACHRAPVDPPLAAKATACRCHLSDVTFARRQRSIVLEPFAWGASYAVKVVNVSPCCTYTYAFDWRTDGEGPATSGRCCYGTIKPRERKVVVVRIPGIVKVPVTRCELKIAASSGRIR
jgi:hypothetical protein